MAVSGDVKSNNEVKKYIGFTQVKVIAVNPTRSELNRILGKEDSEDDKPIEYVGEDKEHNTRVRLSFWLQEDKKLDADEKAKLFVYSFNITDKARISKDELKTQYINNVAITSWTAFEVDEDGKPTEVVDESLFPTWFTNYIDKDGNDLGEKVYRQAKVGEEELAILLRSWLGKVNFSKPNGNITIDPDRLLKEDFDELKELITSSYSTPFVILTGVRTDENDATKQYQQVYGKGFLPNGFMQYINDGLKFTTDFAKKAWTKFERDVTGEYGFDAYFDLVPLKEYDAEEDVAQSSTTKKEVTKTDANY